MDEGAILFLISRAWESLGHLPPPAALIFLGSEAPNSRWRSVVSGFHTFSEFRNEVLRLMGLGPYPVSIAS